MLLGMIDNDSGRIAIFFRLNMEGFVAKEGWKSKMAGRVVGEI